MTTPLRRVTRVAAYGLVIDDGRILLCRISARVPWHHGKWTLPGGGIEFGESPAEAVVREVHEETGLDVQPTTLIDVDSICVVRDDVHYHGIRLLFDVEIEGGVLRPEVDGSSDLCEWWTPAEARKLPLVELGQVGLDLAFPEE